MNLFKYEPEKFWQYPTTWTKDKIKAEFNAAVASNRYLASEKIDGHWHRIVIQDGVLKVQSRGISTVTGEYGDHTAHVPHIVTMFQETPLFHRGTTMIMGEMYIPGLKDKDMTKIFGSLAPKAIKRQEEEFGLVKFRIFDCLYFDGIDYTKAPFELRMIALRENMSAIWNAFPQSKKFLEVAEQFEGNEIPKKLEIILSEGGEGIVMVDRNSLPTPGKRTARKTIKMKAELKNDIDVFFTGTVKPHTKKYNGIEIETWPYWVNLKTDEPMYGEYFNKYADGAGIEPVTKGYFNSWPGSLEIAVWREGEEFSLGYVSNLTDEMKAEFDPIFWRKKVAIVSGMEFTEDKQIRHPRLLGFRDDISHIDCTYEKIFGEK